jgi:hypothetical protein
VFTEKIQTKLFDLSNTLIKENFGASFMGREKKCENRRKGCIENLVNETAEEQVKL